MLSKLFHCFKYLLTYQTSFFLSLFLKVIFGFFNNYMFAFCRIRYIQLGYNFQRMTATLILTLGLLFLIEDFKGKVETKLVKVQKDLMPNYLQQLNVRNCSSRVIMVESIG
jgi:putative Mn2+ efflux pump MntP